MGAPVPEMNAVDDGSAETLLGSLRTISAPERRKHASVFNYWLSIRGDKQFPPIRDLDPLEISDAGPFSALLEMVGGGEDAEIRHIGYAIKAGVDVDKVGDAPNPSLLSCIASRLPVVAACREAFAFEDHFPGATGKTRCWVTLLPFSATGTWIDYVYAFVSLDPAPDTVEKEAIDEECVEDVVQVFDQAAGLAQDPAGKVSELLDVATELANAAAEHEEAPPVIEEVPEPEPAQDETPPARVSKPSFSAKFIESLASVGGFYGKTVEVEPELPPVLSSEEESSQPAEMEPVVTDEPEEPDVADEPDEPAGAENVNAPVADDEPAEPIVPNEPVSTLEGSMQSKLTEVRAKADEARQAKLRANVALYEGLGAAYDFALDAEDHAEEYLKLVEAQGLKVQLRSPMKPVVKLAFAGMCDDATIAQLEAVLAWALKSDLPRGSLAGQIEEAGGIGPILNGEARAA